MSIIVTVSGFCFGRDVYVAKTGNDSNPGTLTNPYLTIGKAAGVAVAGDVVHIRQGIYEETLTPANTGMADSPIIFQAYAGEDVMITAMQPLSGWTLDSSSVYKTTVDWDLGQKNFVVNGETACDLARWPNNTDGDLWTQNGLINTGGSDGTLIYDEYLDYAPGIPDLMWEDGGSLYFYSHRPGGGWLTWRAFIKSSTTTRVTFDLDKNPEWIRTYHPPYMWSIGGDFWLQGIKDALDYQNEWYLDPNTLELFVQIPGGGGPADGQISMRKRDLTIDLGNKNYIEIRNLKVYGGSIEIAGSNNILFGVTSLYGNWHLGIVTGIRAGSQSVYLGGSNNTVQECEIAYGAGTGIWDNGINNLILNSYIHDFDYLGDYSAIILASSWTGGNSTRLIGNTIARGGRDALNMGTKNCEIAYNDISQCALVADDCGLFYNNGGPKNIEIHHNWFHDAYSSGTKYKACGIYLDNSSNGYSVHHNVVWNTEWSSVQINKNGTDLDIFNNTLWNGSAVMGTYLPAFTDVRVWNNLSDDSNWSPEADNQNNLTVSTNPFMDSANGDFRLNAGTTPIDYGREITGITDGFVGANPDAGAYEFGGYDWLAGADYKHNPWFDCCDPNSLLMADISGPSNLPDCTVDMYDLAALAINWLTVCGEPGYWISEIIDDCVINTVDFSQMAAEWKCSEVVVNAPIIFEPFIAKTTVNETFCNYSMESPDQMGASGLTWGGYTQASANVWQANVTIQSVNERITLYADNTDHASRSANYHGTYLYTIFNISGGTVPEITMPLETIEMYVRAAAPGQQLRWLLRDDQGQWFLSDDTTTIDITEMTYIIAPADMNWLRVSTAAETDMNQLDADAKVAIDEPATLSSQIPDLTKITGGGFYIEQGAVGTDASVLVINDILWKPEINVPILSCGN